ncbi:hypothetical protein [Parafrankia soli]|uniref:hypothetical protein n=1 Tax=Parafrankia soli TaxID=2599596 RepID=UPI0012FFC2BA|nr:hypothetical protein [Parafrankia soli]
MRSNKEIQRAAALAESNRARKLAATRVRNGCSDAVVRSARDTEQAAWLRYRDNS